MLHDEDAVDRWVGLEMGKLTYGLVTRTKSLRELLEEDEPHATTREGERYPFDKTVLQKLAAVTSEAERGRLRLPITLRFHLDLENQASVEDELAAAVLRRLGGVEQAYPFREGRAWFPYSLGLEFLLQYPTAVQRLLLP
ncbi:MAG: DUF61 family protein [Thermoplasmata archaeon]